jgi:iron complex outermembrane receptor protein
MKHPNPARRPLAPRLNPVSGAVALAMGSMAILPAGPSQAQGLGQQLFEESLVTATRRETPVQDIPYNISAVSGKELRELQITDIAQLARWVPGMILVDQGRRSSAPLIIRGVSVSDLTFSEASGGNSNGNTVATYVGEIPVYIDLVTTDLQRVEILRGPQGTLFGANSLAGAVRYIAVPPNTDAFAVDVNADISAIDKSDDPSTQLDAVINVPLLERLAFRAVGNYQDRAGFIDQNYLVLEPGFSNPEPDFNDPADVSANLRRDEDVNDVEMWYARASLLWDITDNLDAMFTYHYQDQTVGGRQVNHRDSLQVIADDQGATIPDGFYDNGSRVKEPNEKTNNIFELVVTADLGFAELTSATGYVDYDDEGNRDQTDLLLTFGYTYADFPTFTAFTREVNEEESTTQELRLVSSGDGPLSWIGGFFYADQKRDASSLEFTPCLYDTDPTCPPGGSGVSEIPAIVAQFGNDVEYIQLEDRQLEEWALFGEVSYQFTDQFQMTFGARYFDVEDDFSESIGLPLLNQILGIDPDNPGEQIALNSTSAKESVDDVIYKFNASYDINDESMAYFTFSQGYRNGGSNAIANCDDLPVNDNVVCGSAGQLAYKPDTTDNYELGLRNQFLDGRMTLNGAIYYIHWDQVQVGDVSESGAFPITLNGDDATSKGLELEFNWQINDNWAFRGSYAYTDAELANDAPLLAEGTAQKGDRLPGTPEHQGTAFVHYTRTLNADLELSVDYGLTAQSNVLTKLGRGGGNCCRPYDGVTDFVNPGPGESLSGFAVHYASVMLSAERWSARLYANNLWNKEQVTGVRADRSLIGRADGGFDPAVEYAYRRYFNYVLTPREIGLDLRYRFGSAD